MVEKENLCLKGTLESGLWGGCNTWVGNAGPRLKLRGPKDREINFKGEMVSSNFVECVLCWGRPR